MKPRALVLIPFAAAVLLCSGLVLWPSMMLVQEQGTTVDYYADDQRNPFVEAWQALDPELSQLLRQPDQAIQRPSAELLDSHDQRDGLVVLATHPIGFLGRYATVHDPHATGDAVVFGWPGFEINAVFTGASSIAAVLAGPVIATQLAGTDSSVTVNLNDVQQGLDPSPHSSDCDFNVYVDGVQLSPLPPKTPVLSLSTDMVAAQQLVSGLDETAVHSVRIVKRTDSRALHTSVRQGVCAFYGFRLHSTGQMPPRLLPPPRPAVFAHGSHADMLNAVAGGTVHQRLTNPPRLVFYGDSVTAGSAALQNISCAKNVRDVRASYSSKVTKALHAEAHYIARSGMGVLRSNSVEAKTVMKDVMHLSMAAPSAPRWDTTLFAPDVLVLNLGTNDFIGWGSITPAFAASFTEGYQSLIQELRVAHNQPNLPVYLLCGPMHFEKAGCEAIKAVADLVGGTFLNVTDIIGPSDWGCRSHPGESGNEKIAAFVAERLRVDFADIWPQLP
ncbi:hypothetical protein CAOG_08758 [Capsaspora owczarzaki ATCC 30864]|uniref:SGNH hydrolase-type esterase domain-containing protein n=1 Tax=Capsaspora owczarzaki (strain ATCC 30864) TaxID=595528 RepID=A0A0D2WQP5_CAPO3|nr:hypothetical protein CAOG_08758 [Capsaspora owczarzaki ATCC 30864]KJE93328.1 hypothetical protein CAOG_008758 [Capsaspora owczarzaki ATCC 30864]|eukprot:XP_011270388.1 hypothetical protein CAOG_08758 [Capsaspora owczarzaki ATCC 30864]